MLMERGSVYGGWHLSMFYAMSEPFKGAQYRIQAPAAPLTIIVMVDWFRKKNYVLRIRELS